jgi:uncharacterized protein (DUF1501 family)
MKRRNFLKNITASVALPSLLNGFGMRAYAASPLTPLLNGLSVDTDHVLVLVQLSGGNDGLNTVVPLDQYSQLYNGRPHVVLPENSVLPLTGNDTLGLHPALDGLRQLYDQGRLRIVQNVGYPDPNYSHFRSTDIWMSGADTSEYLPSGWAGRYLAYEYPNFPSGYPNPDMPHPLAVEIGYSLSLSLMGPQTGMGFVISDPDSFYNLLSGVQDPAPNTPAGEQLAYVRLVAQQSRAYAQSIIDASASVTSQVPYPDTDLAAQLKIVARLIAGGLKTRLYVVNIGGFDTHDEQVDPADHRLGIHADLLKELGDAVLAFTNDVAQLGVGHRVTGMTFSEFGRRIASNASLGTDHGEAAPLFVFGQPVAGGILGDNPQLPAFPTSDDALPMQFDFRSVYGTMLRDWFCVPEAEVPSILLHDLPFLDLFQSPAACLPTSVHQANQEAGRWLIRCAPNPVDAGATITYRTEGGPTVVQIVDVNGKVVQTLFNDRPPKGEYQVAWDAGGLPAGAYYCRLLNGSRQQTKTVVKTGR